MVSSRAPWRRRRAASTTDSNERLTASFIVAAPRAADASSSSSSSMSTNRLLMEFQYISPVTRWIYQSVGSRLGAGFRWPSGIRIRAQSVFSLTTAGAREGSRTPGLTHYECDTQRPGRVVQIADLAVLSVTSSTTCGSIHPVPGRREPTNEPTSDRRARPLSRTMAISSCAGSREQPTRSPTRLSLKPPRSPSFGVILYPSLDWERACVISRQHKA
jgi:hypothetical protein